MKRTTLKRKTPLRSKTPLRKVSKKHRQKAKEFEKARAVSFDRSKGRCLICGKPATDGHHFIYLSQCGMNVPENIIPLCTHHHTGDEGIHTGVLKHMDIYCAALIKRPDIAQYVRTHIGDWAKHADPDLVDQLMEGGDH